MLLSSSISADLRDPIDVHSSADRRAQQSPLLGQSDSQRIEQDAASIPTTSLNTTATAASSKDDPNTTSTAASSKDDPIIAAESSGVNATPTAPAEASPQLVALINTNAMGNETASVSPRSNTSLFKTNEATPVTAPSVNAVVTAPSPQAAAVTIASPAGEVVTISAPVTAPHLKPPVTVPSSQAAAVTAMAPAEVAVTNAAPVSAPPVKAVVTNPSPQTAAVPIASSAEGVATISAPVTAPSVPNDSTLKPPADKNETERMDDDVDGISRFMAPGVLVIVVVLVIGVRKMLCPSSDARGSPVHGKYQGVYVYSRRLIFDLYFALTKANLV